MRGSPLPAGGALPQPPLATRWRTSGFQRLQSALISSSALHGGFVRSSACRRTSAMTRSGTEPRTARAGTRRDAWPRCPTGSHASGEERSRLKAMIASAPPATAAARTWRAACVVPIDRRLQPGDRLLADRCFFKGGAHQPGEALGTLLDDPTVLDQVDEAGHIRRGIRSLQSGMSSQRRNGWSRLGLSESQQREWIIGRWHIEHRSKRHSGASLPTPAALTRTYSYPPSGLMLESRELPQFLMAALQRQLGRQKT